MTTDPTKTTHPARIDYLETREGQFLVSPSLPGVRFPVIPENGSDRSGLVYSIWKFRKEILS